MCRSLAVLLTLLAFAPGCSLQFLNSPGVPGSGVMKTEHREVGSFDRVSFSGSGDIEFVVANETSCEIEGDDNLLEMIETENREGLLTISFKGNLKPTRKFRFRLTGPGLNLFSLAGAGDFSAKGLDNQTFEGTISGAGSIRLEGKSESLKIRITGSGDVLTDQLAANDVSVSIVGSGEFEGQAQKSLDVNIAGSGSVVYSGEPVVKKSVAGSGSVKKK